MEIDQLRAFLSVVDHGSVLVAAAATGQPRSTVRAKVEALEAELGVPLFTRTRTGAVPTEAALALVPEARAILSRVVALPAAVRAATDELVGGLHIRLPLGLPPEVVALGAAEVRRRFPGLRLRASYADDPTVRIPDDVDLVLHFGPSLPRGPFRTSVVTRVPEHLVASRSYIAQHGRPATVAALAEHTLLSWQPPGETGQSWPTRDGRSIPVDPVVVSPDVHQVRMLVAHGLGIALLPDAPIPTTVLGEDLERVLPDEIGRECAVRIVVPEARATHPRVRAAVRLVQELAEGTLGLRVETPAAAG